MRAGIQYTLLLILTLPVVARAQDSTFEDDDEFVFDDELPSTTPDTAPADPVEDTGSDPLAEPTDDDIIFDDAAPSTQDDAPEDPFFEEDDSVAEAVAKPGSDTADIFRAQQRAVADLPVDDEVMSWEAYLKQYPNSIFRARIERRIEELFNQQYDVVGQGAPVSDAQKSVDLRLREVDLVTGINLPNLNPRRRVRVGVLFGYPFHMQAWADFEWAFLRKMSVHGGVWGRYQGWGLEVGVRGSPVKSGKDQVVLTPALDLRLNFGPLAFVVRPQLGVGKIFGERVQLLANFGADITANKASSVAVFGDLHLSVRVAQPVAVFIEGGAYARRLTRAEGAFVFGDAVLGLRFFPKLKNHDASALQIDAAGMVRTASRYLQYYQGAVALQGVYNLQSAPKR